MKTGRPLTESGAAENGFSLIRGGSMNDEAKVNPRPWSVVLTDDGASIRDSDNQCVTFISHDRTGFENDDYLSPGRAADVRLIAAAPEMLAALRAYESIANQGLANTTDDEWDEAKGLLDTAITKATP